MIELFQAFSVEIHVENSFAMSWCLRMPAGSSHRRAVGGCIPLAHQGKGTTEDGCEADGVDEREQHGAETAETFSHLNVKNC